MTYAPLGGVKSGLEALFRETGWKGVVAVYVPECLKIILAVVVGYLLLMIRNHAAAGSMLAYFCLLMGTAFPATRRFKGGNCLLALCVGALCVSFKAGLFVVVVFAVVLALWRYLSLACICASLAGILGVWVFVEESICIELSLFCALIIIARHFGHILRIIHHQEPKISARKDLSYKFDEEF